MRRCRSQRIRGGAGARAARRLPSALRVQVLMARACRASDWSLCYLCQLQCPFSTGGQGVLRPHGSTFMTAALCEALTGILGCKRDKGNRVSFGSASKMHWAIHGF